MAHHYPGPPRSEEGPRRGGHTRPVASTVWGTDAFVAPTNTPAGDPAYTVTGSHAPKPPHPLAPGASEGNPKGFNAIGRKR
jgi:hypothetical protein